MLLEASEKGAIVNLEDIPRNEDVSWENWLKSYPGSGFVFTASEDKCDDIINYLKDFSIESNVVGEVTSDKSLYLVKDNEKLEVFNQNVNPVFKKAND